MSTKRIIKFEKDDCNPCNMVSEYLDRKGVVYETINPFNQPELAMQFRVRSVPTVILMEQEQELQRVIGFKPEELSALLASQGFNDLQLMTWIYYDSKTGNVERFVNRLKLHRDWRIQKIGGTFKPEHAGHLITYTTGFGEVPLSTLHFLEQNSSMIKSVTASGNKNWGPNYGMAATKISAQFHLPVLMQFELSGTMADIQKFIDNIEG